VSAIQDVALRLIAVGMLGGVWMFAYLQACKWADWELIPAHRRSSVLAWQRRAPLLIVLSAAVAGLGLLLTLLSLVT
jgi:hypothetical protein